MCRLCLLAVTFAATCIASDSVTLADFTNKGHGWQGNSRTREMRQSADGFSVELAGEEDPWLEGPAVAVPGFGEAHKLVLTLDAECAEDGAFHLFFAPQGKAFTEELAVPLPRVFSSASTYQTVIPLVSDRLHFRLDPPGCVGRVTLRALRVRPLVPLATPSFEKPSPLVLGDNALPVASGMVQILHDPARWNAFACFVNGQKMAEVNPAETFAFAEGKRTARVPLAKAAVTTRRVETGFEVNAKVRDEGDATWLIVRRFTSARGGVRIDTSVTVDRTREMTHLPWLTLFSGIGTFGERKRQALLPGVEYLDDEPSSNEKEIRGTAANRRMVNDYKVCYPMMALAADGNWLSLTWHAGVLPVSPLFDSPDRVFKSGGHIMGVWSPAVGAARFESEFLLYGAVRLEAGKTYSCSATLSGGKGDTVAEAVKNYVACVGLPPLPQYANGFDDAVRLLAAGWLDSAARDGNRWRHAVFGDHFPVSLAEDVPAYLLWLAANSPDVGLKERLAGTAQTVITNLPSGCYGVGGISHIRRPTGALLYGNLFELVRQAGPRTEQLAKQLSDGVSHYRPGKTDYASTLGSDHCNGFTAMSAEEMLSNASLTGDEKSIQTALAVLDKMTAKYAGHVPRGAQPWEMPLHTPDIVASGRLIRCYVLGYLLSGKANYLEEARYWAWTGVTMLYLAPPTKEKVGLYATIGVIGATNWRAPNWIGQPVQWCGLVYRSALEDLARVDAAQRGTWQTLARGMTLTGLQMCFPVTDEKSRGGLLPDYFLLREQKRDGPAINPGTLQAHLAETYGKTPMYTVTRLANGSLLHAPGDVRPEQTDNGTERLTITAWPESEYRVLITRSDSMSDKLLWNNVTVTPQRVEGAHAMVATLKGSGILLLHH